MPRTPVRKAEGAPFPFGPDLQLKLLKLLMLDDGQQDMILHHVKPQYFATSETRWVFQAIASYWSDFGRVPSFDVLFHAAQSAGPALATLRPILDKLRNLAVPELDWLKLQLIEWTRENHFFAAFRESQAIWNSGDRKAAQELMLKKMDEAQEIMWKSRERVFVASELAQREMRRKQEFEEKGSLGDAIPTGIAGLDAVLNGGLSPGELAIWVAYMKGGKSTMLLNHGAVAASMMKNVVHFVLEGSVAQVVDRYDAFFAREAYWQVKLGQMSSAAYGHLFNEYKKVQKRLVLVGLLEKFDYTILDIDLELKELRRTHGWVPDMVIIDYGDLLQGRGGPYASGWQSERDAFRDMKILANRGYALWTASQAQRPDTKNYDTNPHLLKVSQVAGAIEKARVTDFIGSLNSTAEERSEGWLRVYAEMYRDNNAGKVITLPTEPAHMRFVGVQKAAPAGVEVGPGVVPPQGGLGYVQ